MSYAVIDHTAPPHNKLLLQSDRVFKGVRLRYAAPDLIRFAPAAEQQIR